ncbi:unnamed protein product [Rhizophagus irregularis]|nr:unnamed protein product [Rhizophagus irregularis]
MVSDYPIYKYLGSNISLSNLSELRLVSSSNYNDFYHELAQICRSIEKIYIDLTRCDLPEITELIEMQNRLNTYMINNMESECILEHVIYLSYHNLQILDLVKVSLDIAINIIQNTNGNLWKIKIRRSDYDHIKEYDQTIHQYCPNIKYVSLFITDDETLKELENIFIKCQHLVAIDILNSIGHEYENKLLNLFVDSAPLTLYKFHIDFITTDFDRESLKLFFTNWNRKGRKTLHLYHIYNSWHGKFVVKDIIELDYYNDDFWNHRITMLNDEKND